MVSLFYFSLVLKTSQILANGESEKKISLESKRKIKSMREKMRQRETES